jgi:hypothetical protein
LVALCAGTLVGLGSLWISSWTGASTTASWLALVVNGLVFGWFAWLGLAEVTGLRFARFARGGWRIYFADHQYEREFDQLNGLPAGEMLSELTLRERLAMLGICIALLFVVALLGGVAFGPWSAGRAFLPGALLALSLTALAAGFSGITGKGKNLSKRLMRTASHAELRKGYEHVAHSLEESGAQHAGTELSTLYRRWQRPLSPALGWGIFLGFLAAAMALLIWLALKS